jgi:multiple sugar transport system substrate-binding protein
VAKPEHFPETDSFFNDLTQPHGRFDAPDIIVEAIPWERLWLFIQNRTLAQSGLDVSEVGTTWLGTLSDNQLLRQFSDTEISLLGGAESFSATAWQNAFAGTENRVQSIPWMSDTRVVYYWKEMFEQAGIDGATAFSSIETAEHSLATLHSAAIPAWGAPTFSSNNNIHHAASWLWATGKDFICTKERRTTFCDDTALEGLTAYFRLGRYMPFSFDSLDALIRAFMGKKIAAIMDGAWLLNMIQKQASNDLMKDLGITLPPGPPFVGGSSLVIWKFVPKERIEASLHLVQQLISLATQSKLAQANGLLPVRKELLHRYPFSTNPHYETFRRAERKGKHPPRVSIWGPLESSLVNSFGQIWREVRSDIGTAVPDIVKRHLLPLRDRFDRLIQLY